MSKRHRAAALLLVVGLVLAPVLAGCGGDDGDDQGADAPSPFCADVAAVQESQARLSEVSLSNEADVPEAKAELLAFLDAVEALDENAPTEVRAEAQALVETAAEIRPQIEGIENALELGTQVPPLLTELGAPANQLVDTVRETCAEE